MGGSTVMKSKRRNMKKKYAIFIIAIAASKVTLAGCNLPQADQPQILTIEAVDTSTTAGTRKSTSTLVMVSSGSARTADITITTAGTIGSSYPTWSAGVTASAGDYTASFSGSADKSITATVKDDSGDCSDSKLLTVKVIDEAKVEIDIDSDAGYFKKVTDSVESALKKITGEDRVSSVSGKITGEFKLVDKYNNGSAAGVYANVSANMTAEFTDFEVNIPVIPAPIPGVPGVTMQFTVSATDISAGVSGSGTIDPSIATPGTLEVSADASATVGVGAVAAVAGNLLKITLSGGTTISGTAQIALTTNGETGSLDATGTVSNSDLVANYEIQASAFGSQWTLVDDSYTFENTSNSKSISGNIKKFGEA